MRMTYRQMFQIAQAIFTEEQWNMDVTVEDGYIEECYPASLRIVGNEHDSLDENHPVIYIENGGEVEKADEKKIEAYIESLKT